MERGLQGESWGERWGCLPRRGGCQFPAVHPPRFPSLCPQAQEEAVSGAVQGNLLLGPGLPQVGPAGALLSPELIAC